MADKQCADCGELNPEESNFCSNCGARKFHDLPPGLSARLTVPGSGAAATAVRLSLARVILLSMLSAGFYAIYWFYLTWKQLASETTEDHHPVWHALSLLVPIYGLFSMHRHVTVLKELAVGAGLTASLSPGLAVVLWAVSNALDWSTFRVTDAAVLIVLTLISAALSTTLVVLAQSTLNQFWVKVRGTELREARIGVGEVIIVLVGLLVWVGAFMPAE